MKLKPAQRTLIDGVSIGAHLSTMQVKLCFRKGERVLLAVVTPVSDKLDSMDIAMEGETLDVHPHLQELHDVLS